MGKAMAANDDLASRNEGAHWPRISPMVSSTTCRMNTEAAFVLAYSR